MPTGLELRAGRVHSNCQRQTLQQSLRNNMCNCKLCVTGDSAPAAFKTAVDKQCIEGSRQTAARPTWPPVAPAWLCSVGTCVCQTVTPPEGVTRKSPPRDHEPSCNGDHTPMQLNSQAVAAVPYFQYICSMAPFLCLYVYSALAF